MKSPLTTFAAPFREDELPGDATIGHVHLRVADLDRAADFYREVLGLKVVFYGPAAGLPVVFLATGNYHHHIALSTFESAGGTSSPVGHTGLHHFAILYPGELSLARAAARVLNSGHPIHSARDHGCSLSVYLQDPDGNGIELYYDRPRKYWFDSAGRPVIESEPFDLRTWMQCVSSEPPAAVKSSEIPIGLAAQDFSEVLS